MGGWGGGVGGRERRNLDGRKKLKPPLTFQKTFLTFQNLPRSDDPRLCRALRRGSHRGARGSLFFFAVKFYILAAAAAEKEKHSFFPFHSRKEKNKMFVP